MKAFPDPQLCFNPLKRLNSAHFPEITRVYVSVSNETHYVSAIRAFLEKNRDSIQHFHVKNSDAGTSKLLFPEFQAVTRFGATDWFYERPEKKKPGPALPPLPGQLLQIPGDQPAAQD